MFWIWLFSKRKLIIKQYDKLDVRFWIIRLSVPFKKIKFYYKITDEDSNEMKKEFESNGIFPIGITYCNPEVYYNENENSEIKLEVGYIND